VLPEICDALVRRDAWKQPEIFGEIQRQGEISDDEMARVFNLGIGMIVTVGEDDVFAAHDVLRSHGVDSVEIGEVVAGSGNVRL
jgi:phosphoribosylformylglycinamidine cyclo-ligase